MARGLKFGIYEIEGLYYLCSENKGTDQLRGYREADLRLCFAYAEIRFSHVVAHIYVLFSFQQGDLNSFLWTLKRDPPSYFFGTIHVPYTRVWEHIPENTKTAFKQSENIFFELDLTNPYTMSALAKCQLLPHGESLSNILPTEMYTRLKEHLDYVRETMPSWMTADQKGKGLYADYLFNVIAGNWERKRPIWVMLMVNSLTESDIKS